MGATPDNYRISPFTLEFVEAAAEDGFQQEIWQSRSGQNRVTAICWVLVVLFSLASGDRSGMDVLDAVFVAFNLIVAAGVLLASLRPRFDPAYDALFSLLVAALILLAVNVVIRRPETQSFSAAAFIAVPLVLTVALSLRMYFVLLLTAVCLTSYYWMLRRIQVEPETGGLLILQAFTASGVGLVIYRLIAISRRSEFRRLALERELNVKLTRAMEQLSAAKEAAESANRLKSEFLAHMSHDIRTPMNGVLGLSALLDKTGLDTAQRRFLSAIRESASNLLGLLDNLLDLSKIEAGKVDLTPSPYQPSQLVGTLGDLLRPVAEDKGLEWVVRCEGLGDIWVCGDRARMQQVLLNLANNAIKFTRRGRVELVLEVVRVSGGCALTFRITDTGIGIAPEHREKIFENYYRVGAPDTGEGAGLGLGIAARLVAAMGGKLDLESIPGQGTVAVFTVVQPETVCPLETGKATPARLPAAWRVLVAEDNRVNAMVAEEMIRGLGAAEVRVVVDGRAAVEACRGSAFDLVVMDCAMPVMDGYEALAALRNDPATAWTPVLALTAYASEDSRRRVRAAGFDGFLAKPFSETQFLDAVAHLRVRKDGAIDRDAALKQMGGRSDLLDRALTMAAEDVPALRRKMADALGEARWTDLHREAHALKGLASTLHAKACRDAAARMDAAAQSGDEAVCRRIWEECLPVWDAFERALAAYPPR
jgi:signal transduction histidine kinase/CheY-like chemotaxis protein